MAWIELHVLTEGKFVPQLSNALTEQGAQAVTFQDAGDDAIFEPTPETTLLWPKTKIIALFDKDYRLKNILRFIENEIRLGHALSFHLEHLPDQDWERLCLESFKPIRCGQRLWICPSWQKPPDPKAVNIIIDPGLAFGTGNHPTTFLCLNWLECNINDQKYVIDYGCGSGILGIAALKLGAKSLSAVDNDPLALSATLKNVALNGLDTGKIRAVAPEEQIPSNADILIANILLNPLIKLKNKFANLLKPGGKIVLSGLLVEQINDLIFAYSDLFVVQSFVRENEWVRIEGIRK